MCVCLCGRGKGGGGGALKVYFSQRLSSKPIQNLIFSVCGSQRN